MKQMDNQLFAGATAAVASINLEKVPEAEVLASIGADDDILAVSVTEVSS